MSSKYFLTVAAVIITLIPLMPSSPVKAEATFSSGFSQEVAASGFGYDVTNIAWLANGDMLVAQKGGQVSRISGGIKYPFADISQYSNDNMPGIGNIQGDRGLLGMEVDHNGNWLYLLFTQNNNWPGDQNKTAKLIKAPITGTTVNLNQAVIILGGAANFQTFSCENLPVTADCIASDASSHTVGSVRQASDGTLYVTTGDGARFDDGFADIRALRSQNLDSLAGKVLHIDTDGHGLAANPFFSGDAHANRSKVWAYGFRNPFRMNLQPGTNAPVLGDTQWNTTEEQDYVVRGGNYGWPCYEGTPRQQVYANDPATKPACDNLYAQGAAAVKAPFYEYDRFGQGAAATGGAFYTGNKYPTQYQGAWFFGDYAQEFLKYVKLDNSGNVTQPVTGFADQIPVYVGMQMGPDGYLYYASLTTGNIYRIVYDGATGINCGANQFTANYYSGRTPTGTPLLSQCIDTINHNWQWGSPGQNVPADNFSASYSATKTFAAGIYDFALASDDGARLLIDDQIVPNMDHWVDQGPTTYTTPVTLTAGPHTLRLEYYENSGTAQVMLSWTSSVQHAPDASIAVPQNGSTIIPNATVNFAGSATDVEDGILADSQLSWVVGIEHCADTSYTDCHYHPLTDSVGATGNFIYPDHGPNEIYFIKLSLTATDSSGLEDVQTVNLYPDRTPVTACPATQFQADYFVGTTPGTTPAYSTCLSTIDQNWQWDAPAPTIPGDGFSARYTITKSFTADSYRLTTTSDDGSRVYIDGQILPELNGWSDHGPQTLTTNTLLNAGSHQITVEYYENSGQAQMAFDIQSLNQAPLSDPVAGWTGEYWPILGASYPPTFPNSAAVLTRTDSKLDFSWDYGSPSPVIPGDQFIARWSGLINFPAAGNYEVSTLADDGIRVKINGAVVLDEWRDQGAATRAATFAVAAAGQSAVVVEYYEHTGQARVQVQFKPSGVPVGPTNCPAGQFTAQYFAGVNLAGSALATSCITDINYNWQYAAPASGVPADSFSARYTQTQNLNAGTRTMTVTADDGFRVFIDGQLVPGLNHWQDQGPTTHQASVNFTGGSHTIVIEYYENSGGAQISYELSDLGTSIGQPVNGWQAQYWNIPNWLTSPIFPTIAPTIARTDASINHQWSWGSPDAVINGDQYMARWTGSYNVQAGTYQISTLADDGIRVFVDGAAVINNWTDQGPTRQTQNIVLSSGNHTVVVEYFEHSGEATVAFDVFLLP